MDLYVDCNVTNVLYITGKTENRLPPLYDFAASFFLFFFAFVYLQWFEIILVRTEEIAVADMVEYIVSIRFCCFIVFFFHFSLLLFWTQFVSPIIYLCQYRCLTNQRQKKRKYFELDWLFSAEDCLFAILVLLPVVAVAWFFYGRFLHRLLCFFFHQENLFSYDKNQIRGEIIFKRQ